MAVSPSPSPPDAFDMALMRAAEAFYVLDSLTTEAISNPDRCLLDPVYRRRHDARMAAARREYDSAGAAVIEEQRNAQRREVMPNVG